MISNIFKAAAVAVFALATSASAESWTLDGDASKLSFGSVKKDVVGETHSFENIDGTVSGDGAISLNIDLTSVETNIDIRNERMMEHVFQNAKTASLSGEFDMDEVKDLAIGASTVVDMEGVLSFVGAEIDIEAEMFVVRISDTKVLATTNDMIWLGSEDAGIMAGVDKLMELAKLPGITRTSPVTVRLMFNLDDQKAEAAPAAPTSPLALSNIQLVAAHADGDVKAGKKVFKKCKACHSIKEGKNGAGPTLYNIVGATAGANPDFKGYSNELKASGVVWDMDSLAAFLAKPKDFISGTNMAFSGLKKEKDIVNLLAYLANP